MACRFLVSDKMAVTMVATIAPARKRPPIKKGMDKLNGAGKRAWWT